MITSQNSDIEELLSINYGADDYVTKPFNTQILLARIDRILKRNINNIKYKDLTLDISSNEIIKDNIRYDLSRNEFKILYYLLINKGKIVARDDIINYLWDNNEYVDDNTLTVNINRLRNKLEEIGYKDIITTKRQQGYIIL